jgi:Domain of unknown function (DUF4160)
MWGNVDMKLSLKWGNKTKSGPVGGEIEMIDLDEQLAKLRDDFATVDWITRPGIPGVIEVVVKKLENIKIKIDGCKNHARPHVHIDYGKEYHAASYAIDTGERLAGELDGKYDGTVREFIGNCRPGLTEAWRKIQAGENADAIVHELRNSD